MFAEFLKKDEFYKCYMKSYATRMAKSNLDMEKTISDKTIGMYYNMIPFINLIERNEMIKPYDIIEVANEINKSSGIVGFRKTQVQIKKAENFFPMQANLIPQAFYSLFDNYYNVWNDLDIYEKEAKFHIELVRMQPFEDGNKRTARIVLNYNLCRQNKAPVIITGNETDKYFEYIDKYDIKGFSKYLRNKSYEELEVMLELYQNICGNNFSFKLENEDCFIKIFNNLLNDMNLLGKKKIK